MGHVARQSYTVPDGKGGRTTRHSRKWYCFYRDPSTGREKRVPGYSDKRATEQLLAKLEREAAQVHAGLIPPPVEADLLRRPLADWLAEFLTAKEAAVSQHRYTDLTNYLTAALDGTGWRRFADVRPAALDRFLVGLRAGGLSAGTANNYLAAARSFLRWLSERTGQADPLRPCRRVNAEVGRRRVRRALSEAEFRLLVEVAEASGRVVWCQDGPARALLYLTAGYTGLRARELGRLTAAHLDLTAGTVSLDAGETKARRAAVLPLHPQLNRRLGLWLADRVCALRIPLWPGTWWNGGGSAEMIRADLDAAGIPYRDGRGRVCDFHALRVYYVTSLARAGVSLVVAQRLARHATPALTSAVYTSLEQADLARGVAALPPLPEPRRRGA